MSERRRKDKKGVLLGTGKDLYLCNRTPGEGGGRGALLRAGDRGRKHLSSGQRVHSLLFKGRRAVRIERGRTSGFSDTRRHLH